MNMPDWISNHSFSKLYFLKLDKTCLVTELYPLLNFFLLKVFFFFFLKGILSLLCTVFLIVRCSQSTSQLHHCYWLIFTSESCVCWALLCLVAQLGLTCDPMDCSSPGFSVHGDSPGKNTGVGCCALLQGIFPTQWSKQVSHIAGRYFTIWATTEVWMMYGKGQFHKQKVLP